MCFVVPRYVALDHDNLGARGAAEISGLLGFLLTRRIIDHDARTAFGKALSRRRAEA
jgi:hypothetical protein